MGIREIREPARRRRLRAITILAGVACVLLFALSTRFPGIVERLYGSGAGPAIASLVSSSTGWLGVSLAEFLIVGFVLRQLFSAARGIGRLRREVLTWRRALTDGALRLGADLAVVVMLFYVLWGFHYARRPLEQRQEWNGAGAKTAEIAILAEELVEAANFAYLSLHHSDDAGVPTAAVIDRDELVATLTEGWQGAEAVLGAPSVAGLGYGPPKPLLSSPLLNWLQLSGFYFPWTGEANYNRDVPAPVLPHVMAHEMAHQRGLAREDEANFAGFLMAASAPHDWPRYAAYLFAQGQLLGTLARADRDGAVALARRRFPGVRRDLEAVREHWAQYEGPAGDAARAVNDAYLRSQRVPGGILSYGRSVELLVAYARSRGGHLLR